MPGNPLSDPNWASDLADIIDRYVGQVRSTVTNRAVTVLRALVFGIIIVIIAPVAVTLVVILGTKSLQRLIATATDHNSAVWISYMLIGAILVIAGSVMMSRRYEHDQQWPPIPSPSSVPVQRGSPPPSTRRPPTFIRWSPRRAVQHVGSTRWPADVD